MTLGGFISELKLMLFAVAAAAVQVLVNAPRMLDCSFARKQKDVFTIRVH